MNLPRRLCATALNDVLDRLHRARVSGTLSLRERQGVRHGAAHAVHLWEGRVVSVESPTGRTGGEVDAFARLARLSSLPGFELSFHPPRAPHPGAASQPREATPPAPSTRESTPPPPSSSKRESTPPPSSARSSSPPSGYPPPNREALSTLGLPPDASLDDARRAFRRWALCLHPDRHPDAPPDEQRALAERFARVARAYEALREQAA